jgi:hypothetical protein
MRSNPPLLSASMRRANSGTKRPLNSSLWTNLHHPGNANAHLKKQAWHVRSAEAPESTKTTFFTYVFSHLVPFCSGSSWKMCRPSTNLHHRPRALVSASKQFCAPSLELTINYSTGKWSRPQARDIEKMQATPFNCPNTQHRQGVNWSNRSKQSNRKVSRHRTHPGIGRLPHHANSEFGEHSCTCATVSYVKTRRMN